MAKPDSQDSQNTGNIAVILVRSIINTHPDVRKTLALLGLTRKHSCVIVKNTASFKGMLSKVKDYVTYGEVTQETITALQNVRTTKLNNLTVYHLQPPRKGFERKGVKKSFKQGGALGYRGSAINDLIKRMIPEKR